MFGRIAVLLNMQLKKGKPLHFEHSKMERKVVDKLKKNLTPTLDFALPKSAGQYTVDSGALDGQLGFVLVLDHEDKKQKPVEY